MHVKMITAFREYHWGEFKKQAQRFSRRFPTSRASASPALLAVVAAVPCLVPLVAEPPYPPTRLPVTPLVHPAPANSGEGDGFGWKTLNIKFSIK